MWSKMDERTQYLYDNYFVPLLCTWLRYWQLFFHSRCYQKKDKITKFAEDGWKLPNRVIGYILVVTSENCKLLKNCWKKIAKKITVFFCHKSLYGICLNSRDMFSFIDSRCYQIKDKITIYCWRWLEIANHG